MRVLGIGITLGSQNEQYGAFTLIFDVIFFWKVILSIIFSKVFFRHK
jgi:hypothetical protein